MKSSTKVNCWHLIGNGPGTEELIQGERIIRLNQPADTPQDFNLNISNGLKHGQRQTFIYTGELPGENFTKMMGNYANKLQQLLGTWPSTGLATLFTLHSTDQLCKISCMNLLPSLCRIEELSSRKPLPVTFHNWLGERRVALDIALQVSWPDFWLEATQDKLLADYENPYTLLNGLQQHHRNDTMELIKYLAELPQPCWNNFATQDTLTRVEKLFFLIRHSSHTENWWLFDYQASLIMANIHQKLAIAQQNLSMKVLPVFP